MRKDGEGGSLDGMVHSYQKPSLEPGPHGGITEKKHLRLGKLMELL